MIEKLSNKKKIVVVNNCSIPYFINEKETVFVLT